MRPFISREMRIPRKCDLELELEFAEKLEFPGNVSLPNNGLARYTALRC